MKLRDFGIRHGFSWDAALEPLLAFARDVRQVLNGGFRVRDQIGCVIEVVIDAGALPATVQIPKGTRPIAVSLVRCDAVVADGLVVSGGAILWSEGPVVDGLPTLLLREFGAFGGTARYNCVIAVLE